MSSSKDDDLYEGLAGSDAADPGGLGMRTGGMGPLKAPGTSLGRLKTGMMAAGAGNSGGNAEGGPAGPRPMTSVKGAGFQRPTMTGAGGKVVNALDAVAARTGGPAPPLADKAENSPEEAAKEMERKVHALIEAAAKAAAANDAVMALERAKEAGRKERALVKFKDSNGLSDSISLDLTYCCAFNLAHAYHLNRMYSEALNTYSLIVKNKQYQQAGRLRVNMGAIYFETRQYGQAIKQWRMALDQLPPSSAGCRELRLKIQRNIGHAFVRQGAFQDAIGAFEAIMEVQPEFQSGFNLLLCYYALGDAELMKKGFLRLLAVPLPMPDDPDAALAAGSSASLDLFGTTGEDDHSDDGADDDDDEEGDDGGQGGGSDSKNDSSMHDDDDGGRGGSAGGKRKKKRKEKEVDELAAAARLLENSRDPLREEITTRQKAALSYITNAAKLIAPVIGASVVQAQAASAEDRFGRGSAGFFGSPSGGGGFLSPASAFGGATPSNLGGGAAAVDASLYWVHGYNWIIEQLRRDHPSVASELQICKALEHMQHRQFERAIAELKSFERKDVRLKARAATNLSFLYFLEGDVGQASKYAALAVKHDRYNAKALVNMGNVLLEKGEMDRAKELYLEAIGVEADCAEAIFNLGLVNKQLGLLGESLQAFEKLHTLAPSSPEVLFQIGSLHEAMGNFKQAAKYFNYLLAKVPSDPGVLNRLGAIFAKDEDESQAFHYHSESYRFYPVNLEVISWLGVWFVKSEIYERAIEFFERASEIQPAEVKWKLMVASCHRRMQNYARALECYEAIHAQHPEDIECLRFLIALCKDFGRRHDHYEAQLARLERLKAQQQAQMQAAQQQQPAQGGASSRGDDGYGSGYGGGYGGDDDDAGGGMGGDGGDPYGYGTSSGGAAMGSGSSSGGIDFSSYGVYGSSSGPASSASAGGIARHHGADDDEEDDADDGGAGSAGSSPGGGGAYSSSGAMGAYDDGTASASNAASRLSSGRAGGAAPAPDRGFGSAADRFAAPSLGGLGVPRGGGGGRTKEEEDFGDADVGDLLKD